MLRKNAFNLLTDYNHYIGSRDANGNLFKPDKEYFSFIKDLYVDNSNCLYDFDWQGYIYNKACDLVSGKQYSRSKPQYNVVSKEGEPIVVERKMTAKEKAAEELIKKDFGITSQMFFDMVVAQNYGHIHEWSGECEPVSDTTLAIMRTLSDPYYLQHIENIKNGMFSNIDTKSYWHHTDGESKSDSLLVELIKDFEGKVIFINLWCQRYGICYKQIEELKSIENELPMDSIAFLNICDGRLTTEEVYKTQSEKWGNTNYRLDGLTYDMILNQLGLSQGYPQSAMINKKGQIIKKFKGNRSDGLKFFKKVLLEEAAK